MVNVMSDMNVMAHNDDERASHDKDRAGVRFKNAIFS